MQASFERIDALFHAALEQPEGEREAYLDQACGDDRKLRARLRAMLAHDAGGRDRLADAVAAGRREFAPEPESMPERIGPFRLLRRLGRGGMGTVWLGQRDGSDFSQQVAIKLLRDLDASDAINARLRRERSLLARLEHPHIARLVDGGELDSGTPWVAMEYIEGTGLTRFAEDRALELRARLRLFLQLLDAVAYAHRHLIVHRDIKPENVLVDGDGTLKLLDFGIAKLLEEEAGPARTSTMTVAAAMTPSYASPEQLLGQSVSTQSDIFSLGVVLYELLTGILPFPPEGGDSPLTQQQRICTTQAVAPSRAPSPATPRRRLRGDLDNIVLKALRKEPSRRYASADALAEDLRRYLDGRPVSARPDSWRYRSSKFIARNPVGVAVSLALLATLLAFAFTSRWQAVRLAAERDRARTEAAAAQQVADYMIDLFRVPDPLESANRDLSARDMLDKAAASLSQNVQQSPRLRARMLHVIGLSYANIGAYPQAVRLLREALTIRKAEFGADSFEVSDSLNRLGNIYRMYGHPDLAEPALKRALAIRQARADGPDIDLADAWNNVGLLQYQLGHYRDALVSLGKSVDMHRAASGKDTEAIGIALHNRSLALAALGRYDEAARTVRQAIEIKHALGLDGRSTMANSMAQLASLQLARGNLEDALALRRKSLTLRRKLYPDGHPVLVSGLVGMGRLQLMLGHAAPAADDLQQAAREAERLHSGSKLPGCAACWRPRAVWPWLAVTSPARARRSMRPWPAGRARLLPTIPIWPRRAIWTGWRCWPRAMAATPPRC